MRSAPDGNPYNNWSFPGNVNPYTGKVAPGDPATYLKNYYHRTPALVITPSAPSPVLPQLPASAWTSTTTPLAPPQPNWSFGTQMPTTSGTSLSPGSVTSFRMPRIKRWTTVTVPAVTIPAMDIPAMNWRQVLPRKTLPSAAPPCSDLPGAAIRIAVPCLCVRRLAVLRGVVARACANVCLLFDMLPPLSAM